MQGWGEQQARIFPQHGSVQVQGAAQAATPSLSRWALIQPFQFVRIVFTVRSRVGQFTIMQHLGIQNSSLFPYKNVHMYTLPLSL